MVKECGHMVTGSLGVWSRGHMVTDIFWMVTDCDPGCSSKYNQSHSLNR